MENKTEYSFWAKITKDGCINIPNEILAELELNIEYEINVCIKPNRTKDRKTTIELDYFDISFNILRNGNFIHKRLKNTVPIREDYVFLLQYYSLHKEEQQYLDVPQLVGVLMKLYGEPDSFYDNFKSSFNYTFDFIITYKNKTPVREVQLVMEIFDYKESLYIEFRRFRENDKDNVLKLIENVVPRSDLNKCIEVLNNYFLGFYKGYGSQMYEKFERYQPCSRMKYGYNGNEFYLFQEEVEAE